MSGNATKGKQDEIIAAIGGIGGGGDASAANQTLQLTKLTEIDSVLDDIKINTDNLASDPATATLQTSTNTKLDTIDGVLDNIKTNTDNLTSDPATATLQTSTNTKLDTIDSVLDQIQTNTSTYAATYHEELVKENVTNKRLYHKFGYCTAGTSWDSINYNNTEFTGKSAGGGVVYIKSDSASDTNEVTIVGYDSSYAYQTETIALNGTTYVTTTNSFAFRINDLYVEPETEEVNVGNITASFSSAFTTLCAAISAGDGKMNGAQQTVAGTRTNYANPTMGWIKNIVVSSDQDDVEFRVMAYSDAWRGSTTQNVIFHCYLSKGIHVFDERCFGKKQVVWPAGVNAGVFEPQVKDSAGTANVNCNAIYVLEDEL